MVHCAHGRAPQVRPQADGRRGDVPAPPGPAAADPVRPGHPHGAGAFHDRRPRRPPAVVRAGRAGRRGQLDRRPPARHLRVQPGRAGRPRGRPRRHPLPARAHRPRRHRARRAPRAHRDLRGSRARAGPRRRGRAGPARHRGTADQRPRRASVSACPGRSSTRPAGPSTRRSCPAGTTPTCPPCCPASSRVPVLVDNDVNVMALGEHTSQWPEVDHLLFVKVATGIGAGIISDGQHPSRGPGCRRRPRAHRGPGRPRPAVPLRQHRVPRGRGQRSGDRERPAGARRRRRRPAPTSSRWSARATSTPAARCARPAGTSARCSPRA